MKIIFKIGIISLGCLLGSNIVSQEKCKKVKKGQFYYTTSIDSQKIILIRSDTLQQEINISNQDTSFYKIEWLNNCMYTTKFLKKTHTPSEFDMMNIYSHKIFFEILTVKNNYYTYRGGFDSINSKMNFTDTIWIKK